MQPIEGKNAILRILKAGTYVPVACVTDFTVNFDKEIIETTTADTALYRAYIASMQSWTVALNSVAFISETGFYTVFELIDKQAQGVPLDIEMAYTDSVGNIKTLIGKILLPHIDLSAPQKGFIESRIDMQGVGELQIDTELITPVTPSEVENEQYTAIGGETSFVIAAVVNKEILGFFWDGIGREIITVGTPTDSQVKFIAATGTFQLPFGALAGGWFLIFYK